MTTKMKNVKISENHHNALKSYCDVNGIKIHRAIQKWIEENCKMKKNGKKDIYGE